MEKKLLDEQQQEEYIEDLLYLQQAEYDRERELLNIFTPNIDRKRLFSHKIRFKNRRNSHRFARRRQQTLPF